MEGGVLWLMICFLVSGMLYDQLNVLCLVEYCTVGVVHYGWSNVLWPVEYCLVCGMYYDR